MSFQRSCVTLLGAGLIAAALAAPLHAAPVGTSFTYQGRLAASGTAFSGAADFRFRLYDAAVGGAQIGPELTVAGVTLNDGLLQVDLDFGAAALVVTLAGSRSTSRLRPAAACSPRSRRVSR